MGKCTPARMKRVLSARRPSRRKSSVKKRIDKQQLLQYTEDSQNIQPSNIFELTATRSPNPEEVKSCDIEGDCDLDVNEIPETRIEGRCIADITYVLDQLHEKFDNHNPVLNCPFRDLKVVHSRRVGLKTQILFQCQMCHTKESVWTDRADDDRMEINRSAVAGAIATGIGFSQMEEFLASMDIHCMSATSYRKFELEMCEAFERAADVEMQKAAQEARNRALAKGDFIIHDNKKIPFITVVADCSWMKRSYKTGKYDSLSGVGAITDYETGNVIYRGVRNKFCAVCEWATRHNKEPNPHVCFKNWGRDQASTGMECDAIVEGFNQSVPINGLIYKTLVADGDSSVYKSMLDTNPYGKYEIVVTKKECKNHLNRRLTNQIKDIAKTPGRHISHLKKLILNSTKKFRQSIELSVDHRKNVVTETNDLQTRKDVEITQAALLKQDILNIPYHVFGDHEKCKQLKGFCNGTLAEGETNVVDSLKKAGLFQQIERVITYFSFHAGSLLYDATNNSAEAYNSIVCKLIGGKRINFGMRGSYKTRCDGSVIQHNTQNILTKLHQSENKQPPAKIVSLEIRRQHKVRINAEIRHRQRILRRSEPNNRKKRHGPDENYGPNAKRPDITEDLYDELAALHNGRLLANLNNRVQIEIDTRQQAHNALWQSLRRKMLTASNFGRVCRMKSTTSCAATVQSILFPSVKNTPGMMWGRTNETTAITALQNTLAKEGIHVHIEPCGLFIDSKLEYLGASPDGVINDDGIVEIKCPQSARQYTPDEAIRLNTSEIPKFFDKKDPTKMNTTHHYYYQVQGQLHITQRLYCYFAVWTPTGLKYVKVIRDDEFWRSHMEPQLIRFYNDCLLPEIIDSRYIRKLPIRDPQYILAARQIAIEKKILAQNSQGQVHGDSEGSSTSMGCTENQDQHTGKHTLDADTHDMQSRTSDTYTDTEMRVLETVAGEFLPRADQEKSHIQVKPDSVNENTWITPKEPTRLVRNRPQIRSIRIIKRASEHGTSWAVSSSDEGSCVAEARPRIMPLKITRDRSKYGSSWSVASSEDLSSCVSDCKQKVPPITLKMQRFEDGDQWFVSSSEEQSYMSHDQRTVAPIRLSKQKSERGTQWVASSSDECPSATVSGTRKLAAISIEQTTQCAAAWITVSGDNITTSPTETEIEILESLNKQVPIADIRQDILKHDSLLSDTSIDNFLEVIRSTTIFETKTTLWLTHPRFIKPLRTERDVQIIGGNTFRHWRCIYFDGVKLNIYDSLCCATYNSLQCEEKKYIELRYPKLDVDDIAFQKVQRQPDNYSCGVFAAAFATTVALGADPATETYSNDVSKMRRHLLDIIENTELSAFPRH